MAATKSFRLTGPDLQILALVESTPGITVPALSDELFPEWSPQWVRERARRLGAVGRLRSEGDHPIRLYPVEADTITHPAPAADT